jgi:hypothetical protein
LKEQPLKTAVLQAVGRKTARAFAKLTGFCKRPWNLKVKGASIK